MARPAKKNTREDRERLQQKRKDLHKQWKLAQKKLIVLEEQLILETRADDTLRIKAGVKTAKANRTRIETQLAKLEKQLEPEDEAPATPPKTATASTTCLTRPSSNTPSGFMIALVLVAIDLSLLSLGGKTC